MKTLSRTCLFLALLQSAAVHADCPLAFAPPEIRRAASEHYYRWSKRDAPAPGRLANGTRSDEHECARGSNADGPVPGCVEPMRAAAPPETQAARGPAQASAIAAPRNRPAADAYMPPATMKQPR